MTKNSKKRFVDVLVAGKPAEIKAELALYKDRGMVSYQKVLEIPMEDRIPELAKLPESRAAILTALAASVGSAIRNINIRNGLNEEQVVEIADMIIDQSHEDNLSLQDVLLFLGDLLAGKCGKIYDRLDIPTFFELFETYRQKRHEHMKGFRSEIEAQYRALPVNDRFVHDSVEDEKNKTRGALAGYLKNNME